MITTRSSDLDQVRQWSVIAARAADDKKGEATVILEVGTVLAIADAFLITSGANPRQVRTIVEEIEKKVKEGGGPAPLASQGIDDTGLVLMVYGDFVGHVFLHEVREFYDLDRLWGDAAVWDWAPE